MQDTSAGPESLLHRYRTRSLILSVIILMILGVILASYLFPGMIFPDNADPGVVAVMGGFFIMCLGLGIAFCEMRAGMIRRILDGFPLARWHYSDADWELLAGVKNRQEWKNLMGPLIFLLVVYGLFIIVASYEYFTAADPADLATARTWLLFFLVLGLGSLISVLAYPWYQNRVMEKTAARGRTVVIAPEGVLFTNREYVWDLAQVRPDFIVERSRLSSFLETHLSQAPVLLEVVLEEGDRWFLGFRFVHRQGGRGFRQEDLVVLVPADQHDEARKVAAFFTPW